jgi:hypothetical protein
MVNKNGLILVSSLFFFITYTKADDFSGYGNLSWGSSPNDLIKEYSEAVLIYRDGRSDLDNSLIDRQYKIFTNDDFSGYINKNITIYSEFNVGGSYGIATKTCRYFFYHNNELFKVWYLLPQIRMPRLDEVLSTLIDKYGQFNDTKEFDAYFGQEKFYFWNNRQNLNIEYYNDGYTGSIFYFNPIVDSHFNNRIINPNNF